MSPLFFVLGVIDTFAAALIFFPFSEALVLYGMVYMIAKGGFFLLTGLASKNMAPLCMGMCIIDIATGLTLGAMSFGISLSIFRMVGMLSLVKGIYSAVTPIFS